MQDSQSLPDDVPVADAVEQLRPPNEPAADEEVSAEAPEQPSLETPSPDWQEQLETVDLEPEDDLAEDEEPPAY